MSFIQSPHTRPSCGQPSGSQLSTIALGTCSDQNRTRNLDGTTLIGVPVIRNVTQFKSLDGTAWDPPYVLAEQNLAPDCSPYNSGGCPDNPCYECGDFGVTNQHVPCFNQTFTVDDIQPCGPGSHSIDLGDGYFNCFAPTNQTTSYAHCKNLGWKRQIVSKIHNGRYSYHSKANTQIPADFDWCTSCTFVADVITPDPNQYLGVSGNSSIANTTTLYGCSQMQTGTADCVDVNGNPYTVDVFSVTCTPSSTTTYTATAQNSVRISKFGDIVLANLISGSSDLSDFNAQAAVSLLGDCDTDVSVLYGIYTTYVTDGLMAFGQPQISGGGDAWTLTFHTTVGLCFDACGNTTPTDQIALKVSINLSDGTLDVFQYGYHYPSSYSTDNFCLSWVLESELHYNYGPEGSLSFTYSEHDSFQTASAGVLSITDKSVDGSLNTLYSSQNVITDLKTLHAWYDMGNDAQMPWRTDTNTQILPYSHWHEQNAIPSIIFEIQQITNLYGQEQGRPLPAGTDQVWSVSHNNWCACDSLVDSSNILAFIRDHGQSSLSINTPCATDWSDNFLASNTPDSPGGVYLNQFQTTVGTKIVDNTVFSVKGAEIVFPKESFNFARFPGGCGADRFQVSGSSFIGDDADYTGLGSGRCVSGITGTTLTLDPSGAPSDINNGDFVWVCGVSQSVDGCWQANIGGGGYTVDLFNFKMSASFFPSASVTNCGTGIVAKLRFQSFQAHICGAIALESITATKPAVAFASEDTYLVNGDKVIVSGSIGMPQINGLWTVSVQDSGSRTVTLIGSDGTTGSFQGTPSIYTPFTTDYRWNDMQSKNDYMTISWSYDFRDVGEYKRLLLQFQTNSPDNGAFGCDSVTPCFNPAPPAQPRPNQVSCSVDQNISRISAITSCLRSTPCSPVVAYFSPVTESFNSTSSLIPNARNHGHGLDTIVLDAQYGSRWQAVVKQSMNDPLWQSPPCPCEADVNNPGTFDCPFFFLEDDGTCEADDPILLSSFFPHIPQYEARGSVPFGAPPPPSGVYLGCLDTTDFTSPTTCPQGNICLPPTTDIFGMIAGVGNIPGDTKCPAISLLPYELAWMLWQAECSCVQGMGRFSEQYGENILGCVLPVMPPPF